MTLTIFTDGGARGNPGPAAIGFVIKNGDQTITEQAEYIGETTNNTAEYQAVIAALNWIEVNQKNITTVSFYLDSKLVINQLLGTFKIKQPHLRSLADQVQKKINSLKISTTFTHIKRENNYRADYLLNRVLDTI